MAQPFDRPHDGILQLDGQGGVAQVTLEERMQLQHVDGGQALDLGL
eukprot:CAMPEP_0170416598 /NCGR_PEP_ID=MMETSP0117_2-20130122/33246_1 /TAXON_ID=400756 /ORGANISM="Durinskia baltica, Strain CSIRO CS-38" /LENGTH=45 /DNA_ID= /DNA_START= /DNA_END= /DNA_ORIENTATION=